MPELPADPNTNNINDPNYCYQYKSSVTPPILDYKLRTNPNLSTLGTVNPTDLNKQSSHIDPASYIPYDVSNCATVQTGTPRGFAVFTQNSCSWNDGY
jgi:hypothetical protein